MNAGENFCGKLFFFVGTFLLRIVKKLANIRTRKN